MRDEREWYSKQTKEISTTIVMNGSDVINTIVTIMHHFIFMRLPIVSQTKYTVSTGCNTCFCSIQLELYIRNICLRLGLTHASRVTLWKIGTWSNTHNFVKTELCIRYTIALDLVLRHTRVLRKNAINTSWINNVKVNDNITHGSQGHKYIMRDEREWYSKQTKEISTTIVMNGSDVINTIVTIMHHFIFMRLPTVSL